MGYYFLTVVIYLFNYVPLLTFFVCKTHWFKLKERLVVVDFDGLIKQITSHTHLLYLNTKIIKREVN